VLPDIEIAQAGRMRPIIDVAKDVGLSRDDLVLKGDHSAKVRLEAVERARKGKQGKLVLVTGITPTRHGEGKTHDGGTRPGPEPPRDEGDRRDSRALARSRIRHEGRRGGRRVLPSPAHGGHQPPLHGGHRAMPGFGAEPAALEMDIDENGKIKGVC